MGSEDDIATSLPKAPIPAPARRAAAIEQAMRRFDAGGEPLPAPAREPPPARSAPWWTSLGRPYAGALGAALLVALVGVPAAWNIFDDPSAVEGGDRRPETVSEAAPPGPAIATAEQADANRQQPSEASRARFAKSGAGHPPNAPTATEATPAPAPAELAQAAPIPVIAAPPAVQMAERREPAPGRIENRPVDSAASASENIVVTGSRIQRRDLRTPNGLEVGGEDSAAVATGARKSSAQADERGDWNACTVDDPSRSLGRCRDLVDPAAKDAAGQAAAHVADGLSLAWKGELDRAIRAFGRAIEIAPQSSFAYLNRGLAYRRSGDPDRALADLDRAVRYAPRAARGYYHRSLLLRQQGDIRRAQADENRAINLDRRYAAIVG